MPLCKITPTTVLAFFSNLQTLDSALDVSQIGCRLLHRYLKLHQDFEVSKEFEMLQCAFWPRDNGWSQKPSNG